MTNESLVTNEGASDISIEIPIKKVKISDEVNATSNLSFKVLLCTDLPETEKTVYYTLNPTKAIDLESIKAKIFINNKEIEILGNGNTYKEGEKIVTLIGEKSINVTLKSKFEYADTVKFE